MASVARRRYGGATGAPVRSYGTSSGAVAAPRSAAAPRAVDPFAAQVTKMNRDLKALQDITAISKLSTEHPEDFIDYAKKRIAEGDTSYPWTDLVKKAENKIEETQWSTDLKDGTKTLEDFQTHLLNKLDSAVAGSSEAHAIMKGLSSVKSSIGARDEAKRDQTALSSYIGSQDHKKYKEYLETKLARTTDGKLQSDITKQIGEMDSRIQKQEASDRAVQVLKIDGDAKAGRITASEAVAKLQAVAGAKNITAAEVNHIQAVTDSVIANAAQKATAAAAAARASAGRASSGSATDKAAKQAVTAERNADRSELAKAQQNIKDKLERGEPVTQADHDRVAAAAAVVRAISEAIVADPHSSKTDSTGAASEAKAAAAAPHAMKQLVDNKNLLDYKMDTKSTAAFNTEYRNTTDPEARVRMLIERADEAKIAIGKMLIPENAQVAIRQGDIAYTEGRKALTDMTKPPKMSSDDSATMDQALIKYKAAMGTNGLSEAQWKKVMYSAPDAATAAKELGIKDPAAVAAFTVKYNETYAPIVSRGAKWTTSNTYAQGTGVDTTGQFEGGENAARMNLAMSLSRNLLATKYGNDTEYSPSDVATFAQGGDPFASTYNPALDESMRARNSNPRAQNALNDMPYGTYSVGDQPEDPAAPVESGGNDSIDPGAQSAPAGNQSPDAQDRNGGYLSDQRGEMFNPTDPLAAANSYLDSGTDVDVGGWSIPELPTYDPIIPDYSAGTIDAGYEEPYVAPVFEEPPPYVDNGGYEGDTTGSTHGN